MGVKRRRRGYLMAMPDLNEAPYTDPTGPDPEEIPDPMPAELQGSESRPDDRGEEDEGESMDGPAPTG